MTWDSVPKIVTANLITLGILCIILVHSELIINRKVVGFNQAQTVYRITLF